MKEYHKIQSIYFRDPENNYKTFLTGQWSTPELEYLQNAEWLFEEKIDGTNIRIMYDGQSIKLGGKTDDAQLHMQLVGNIRTLLGLDGVAEPETLKKWSEIFVPKEDSPLEVCLYGEGYGPGIQKGGGNYRKEKGFILFDVKIGQMYLTRESVRDIARQLNLEVVPEIGRGTLHDGIALVKAGFKSTFGDFMAEGIVARPVVELKDRRGHRIITKIKHVDFAQ